MKKIERIGRVGQGGIRPNNVIYNFIPIWTLLWWCQQTINISVPKAKICIVLKQIWGQQINKMLQNIIIQQIKDKYLLWFQVPAQRNVKFYTCCDEPYLDITFNITMRRKTLFYTVNLIIPCMGISFLTILVFYLPSDSGEKVNISLKYILFTT